MVRGRGAERGTESSVTAAAKGGVSNEEEDANDTYSGCLSY